MKKVMCATLQPASGGFGQWDWVEAVEAECCETIYDYEEMINSMPISPVYRRTDALDGRIGDQRGVVYHFDEGCDPDGNRIDRYEMVWVEEL
jgi:hypothetical protein